MSQAALVELLAGSSLKMRTRKLFSPQFAKPRESESMGGSMEGEDGSSTSSASADKDTGADRLAVRSAAPTRRLSPVIGAALAMILGSAASMAAGGDVVVGPVRTKRGTIYEKEKTPADLERMRRAEEKRQRRAAKSRLLSATTPPAGRQDGEQSPAAEVQISPKGLS